MSMRMHKQAILILVLFFVGTVCSSSMVPMMGLFIVDGLGQQPWKIGIYSALVTVLTLVANRVFGERIDNGTSVRALLLTSILAFLAAATTLAYHQSYLLLVTAGAALLGLANAAMSTTFTFGRLYAEREGLDVVRYNSWLRMQASLAWMFGPALSFSVIGLWGYQAAFAISAALGLVWLTTWFYVVPRGFRTRPKVKNENEDGGGINWLLVVASMACVFFALSNVLYTTAMPIFFIREVGLPSFSPGLSLTTKCLVEIPAIFLAARLARRWGARNVLYVAALVAITAFVAIAEVKTLPQMVVTAALEGLYYGLFAGVAITFVQSFAMGKMGRATSMYVSSLFLGGTLGGVSMGFVATWYDYRSVVLLAAVCAFCALIILFVTRRADGKLARPLAAS